MKKILFFGVITISLTLSGYLYGVSPINPTGRPLSPELQDAKFLVWQDPVGWHIRWSTKGKMQTFSGRIKAIGGKFSNVHGINPYPRRKIFQTSGKTIKFKLKDDKVMDGFDFKTDAKKLKFDLKINGKSRSKDIFIGAYSKNPAYSRFTLFASQKGLNKEDAQKMIDQKFGVPQDSGAVTD